MDVGVLSNRLMALLWRNFNSHKQTDVEVDRQRNERLHTLTMLVRHRVDSVQDHAKSLLMAVRLTKGRCTVLVEADVRLTRT